MVGFALVAITFIFLSTTATMIGSLPEGIALSTFSFFGAKGACC